MKFRNSKQLILLPEKNYVLRGERSVKGKVAHGQYSSADYMTTGCGADLRFNGLELQWACIQHYGR